MESWFVQPPRQYAALSRRALWPINDRPWPLEPQPLSIWCWALRSAVISEFRSLDPFSISRLMVQSYHKVIFPSHSNILEYSQLLRALDGASHTMDSKQQTLRVTGLPQLTQIEDVQNFFGDRIGRSIESVGPISQGAMSQKMQTTVSFSSREAAKKALKLEYANRRFHAIRGGVEYITLNHGFEDITTLHTSNNPLTGRPDIE